MATDRAAARSGTAVIQRALEPARRIKAEQYRGMMARPIAEAAVQMGPLKGGPPPLQGVTMPGAQLPFKIPQAPQTVPALDLSAQQRTRLEEGRSVRSF